jgi:hypothetical protein
MWKLSKLGPLLLLLVSCPSWGYRLTADFLDGFYWATLPIGITVVESDPVRKAMLEELSQAAISEWESKTNLSLWDYSGGGTKNIIRWSSNFAAETRMDARTVLAVAIRYTNGPYFARTEIVINGNHTLNSNEDHLRTTITHELGHTMGLEHSEVSEAIMAPTLQPWYAGLHEDDIEGMQNAESITSKRQVERYVSPLAFNNQESTSKGIACGTVAPVSSGVSMNDLLSLAGGLLISFIRKLFKWFK